MAHLNIYIHRYCPFNRGKKGSGGEMLLIVDILSHLINQVNIRGLSCRYGLFSGKSSKSYQQ